MRKKILDRIPKPSKIPSCSIIMTLLNIVVIFLLIEKIGFTTDFIWYSPVLLLNIFFFWAELDIYKRENRNYIDWKKDMEVFSNKTRLNWRDNISSVSASRASKINTKRGRLRNRRTSKNDISEHMTGPQTV